MTHPPLLERKSFTDTLADHSALLKALGFIESGVLTRESITHAESFTSELDERMQFDPRYADIALLPEIHFLQDAAKQGDQPVYRHHGESNDMIYAVQKFFPGRKFAAAIECFSGAGHAGIKLRNSESLELGAAINSLELNRRAIDIATANSAINNADVKYHHGDILNDGFATLPTDAKKPGNTLYIGNAPFALSTPAKDLEMCRDGGSDGLEKTMAFINASLDSGSEGDGIIGVAYSRIGSEGNYEFEDRLKALQALNVPFTYQMELVEGAKLWRGFNGKKEQTNPMDLDMMVAKGELGSTRRQEYEVMAAAYKEEGWNQLSYVRYAITISDPASQVSEVAGREVRQTLA
jgi:hypothetical protein